MNIDEMDKVSGGNAGNIGVGIVKDKKRKNTAACFVLGFSNGRVCDSNEI